MKLYIYDHCPFCVRARMIFGLRQIPVELIHLANDDEATPIGLIGAKQVPILQKADGSHMGESLDIVRYIDAQAGDSRLNETIRPSIQAWADQVGAYYNQLLFPRSIQLGLPEFATPSAVVYFILKKEASIGTGIAQMLEKTPPHGFQAALLSFKIRHFFTPLKPCLTTPKTRLTSPNTPNAPT